MFRKFVQRLLDSGKKVQRLETSPAGLKFVENDREIFSIRWDQINKIEAYKRDLFTTEMIHIDLSIDGQSIPQTLHDEIEGFEPFCALLTQQYPSIPANWRSDLSFSTPISIRKLLFEKKP